MINPPRSLLLLAFALVACTPGIATVPRAEALLSAAPPPRDGCKVEYEPATLPTLGALADSAALVAALGELEPRLRVSGGGARALFSIGYGRDGTVQRVKLIDYFLPQGAPALLTRVVRDHLEPQEWGEAYLRLLVEPGATPRIRIGRSERCPPVERVRFYVESPVMMRSGGRTAARMQAEVFVDEHGNLVSSRLIQRSGDDAIDRWVIEKLAEVKYAPGLIDGIPTAMLYRQVIPIKNGR